MPLASLCRRIHQLFSLLNHAQSLWWLLVRLWIATVFLKAGFTKIEDFDTAILLFAEEYRVPFLPPSLAALLATSFELACPVALALGLGTRFAALPLLVMTAVIQLTYMDHVQHYYWGIILLGLVLHGAGKLSADYLILQKRMGGSHS